MGEHWFGPREGLEHASLTGVPCKVRFENDFVSDVGTAYKTWGGEICFSAGAMWVTDRVKEWMPMLQKPMSIEVPKEMRVGVQMSGEPTIDIKLCRLPHGDGLPLPGKAHPSDAGIDLPCAEGFTIGHGQAELVPTGFAVELPSGFEAQIRPRSGLAVKHMITVINSPGTIDANYRGEIKVLLVNHGLEPVSFKRGDRIAQMVVQPVLNISVTEVVELCGTDRGTGGFGSTDEPPPEYGMQIRTDANGRQMIVPVHSRPLQAEFDPQ